MTSILPAGTHRPPAIPTSAAPTRSLKRQASTNNIGRPDARPSRHSAGEDSDSKRQKLDSPVPAAVLSDPPIDDPSLAKPIAQRFTRAQETKRQPLELIDGFFVGSEGIQVPQPQSPVTSRSSPLSLPQRPWKHNLAARTKTNGTLNNSGVRKRTDMQVQTVPYKTEPPRDAPRFMADGKHINLFLSCGMG
jgi:hypothetical protein